MRTSPSQFRVIVDFMERHGDLNKPVEGDEPACKNKLEILQKWSTLARTLNMDTSGDRKTVEKWKKVWSDYKNNTKRKAAKIQQAALQTQQNGSSAGVELGSRLVLNNLEKRVLKLMKSHNAKVPNIDHILVEPAVTTSTTEPACPLKTCKDDVVILQVVKTENAEDEHKRTPEQAVYDDIEFVEEPSSPNRHGNTESPTLLRRRLIQSDVIRQRKMQHTRPSRTHANNERWRKVFAKFTSNTKTPDRELDLRNRELDLRDRELEIRNRELILRELELEQRVQDQAQWQMLFAKCINSLDMFLNKE